MSSSGVRRCFLFALILAALALRLWRLGAMPLFSDEAYYLLWVDRLAPRTSTIRPGSHSC